VRFLGRRRYPAVALVLLSAVQGEMTAKNVAALREGLGVARRTLERWRSWWRTQFVKTSFWQAEQGRFMPPLPIDALPESLLARFGGDDMRWRVVLLLRFLLPLTGPGTFTYLDGR
jgi:hypothetical protein